MASNAPSVRIERQVLWISQKLAIVEAIRRGPFSKKVGGLSKKFAGPLAKREEPEMPRTVQGGGSARWAEID